MVCSDLEFRNMTGAVIGRKDWSRVNEEVEIQIWKWLAQERKMKWSERKGMKGHGRVKIYGVWSSTEHRGAEKKRILQVWAWISSSIIELGKSSRHGVRPSCILIFWGLRCLNRMLNQKYEVGRLNYLSWIEDKSQGILRNAVPNISNCNRQYYPLHVENIWVERYLFLSSKNMEINLVTFFHGTMEPWDLFKTP